MYSRARQSVPVSDCEVSITSSFALELLLAPDPRGIVLVPNFEPVRMLRQVRIRLAPLQAEYNVTALSVRYEQVTRKIDRS